jgi:hypothetical protein
MRVQMPLTTSALALTACLCASCAAQTGNEPELLAALRSLKPMSKVHYSYPLLSEWCDHQGNPVCREYVRITHAFSLRAETATLRQIDVAVSTCAAINATKPSIPCTLAINYAPWHRRFGKKLPPTNTGPTHAEELSKYRARLQNIRQWLERVNQKRGVEVRVSAILFDSERFRVRDGDAVWNQAIREKHDAIYRLSKSVFPQAKVIWYQFGAIQRAPSKTGWRQAPWHSLDELHDAFAVDLYRIPEIGYTREVFRRTVENARQHGTREVIPWVALASGYRRQPQGEPWSFSMDWDYDLIYSWALGGELNNSWFGDRPERFAPWNAAPVVCFYPKPGDKRCPAWWKHFIAYVRGANGVRILSDLE